eukprot:TRINITY_DN1271_c0_g1_i1.p1 TRINITY_DN1271_c0_g1~~TRINITY_DN1271_c0_g1_i1.p1  ORF type:complete len:400 (+),score=59.16 TRINITY_DN1271_c0_g1_i1:78-1277(+)
MEFVAAACGATALWAARRLQRDKHVDPQESQRWAARVIGERDREIREQRARDTAARERRQQERLAHEEAMARRFGVLPEPDAAADTPPLAIAPPAASPPSSSAAPAALRAPTPPHTRPPGPAGVETRAGSPACRPDASQECIEQGQAQGGNVRGLHLLRRPKAAPSAQAEAAPEADSDAETDAVLARRRAAADRIVQSFKDARPAAEPSAPQPPGLRREGKRTLADAGDGNTGGTAGELPKAAPPPGRGRDAGHTAGKSTSAGAPAGAAPAGAASTSFGGFTPGAAAAGGAPAGTSSAGTSAPPPFSFGTAPTGASARGAAAPPAPGGSRPGFKFEPRGSRPAGGPGAAAGAGVPEFRASWTPADKDDAPDCVRAVRANKRSGDADGPRRKRRRGGDAR